jgi:hypothetical protein
MGHRSELLVQWLRDGPAGWYVVSNPNYPIHPTAAEVDHQLFVGYVAVARLTTPVAGYPIGTIELWSISLQYWFLYVLFAIAPAWCAAAILHKRRKKQAGFCTVCGYDLRATPDRCPECGTIPTPSLPVPPGSLLRR